LTSEQASMHGLVGWFFAFDLDLFLFSTAHHPMTRYCIS